MISAPTASTPRANRLSGLTYGSFCSGIEAASTAWQPLGWRPLFFSEIDGFPCAVLAHHHPDVPNLGDMVRLWAMLRYGGKRIRSGRATAGLSHQHDDLLARLRAPMLFVAGTPCQSFSVAGHRHSLSDARGNLTMTFVELVHVGNPAFVVWENVPGVLSTKDNAFGCFLSGLVGEAEPLVCRDGSWPDAGMVAGPVRTAAWRVLDAQYFRLAQRRRRVLVVSCRTGDGHNPGAILFEPESLPRDSAPSRKAGTGITTILTSGFGSRGADDNAAQGLKLIPADVPEARDYKGPSSDGDGDGAILVPMVAHSLRADGFDASEDGTGRGVPLVPAVYPCLRGGNQYNNSGPGMEASMLVPVAYRTSGNSGVMEQGDKTAALTTSTDPSSNIVAYGISSDAPGEPCHPLASGAHPPAIATGDEYADAYEADASSVLSTLRHTVGAEAVAEWGSRILDPLQSPEVLRAWLHGESIRRASHSFQRWVDDRPLPRAEGSAAATLRKVWQEGPDGCSSQGRGLAKQLAQQLGKALPQLPSARASRPSMCVRRLTPRECERLMGFPDDFTLVIYRGKPAADGPRYRAIGNSMAVPCMRWIGERINKFIAAIGGAL